MKQGFLAATQIYTGKYFREKSMAIDKNNKRLIGYKEYTF